MSLSWSTTAATRWNVLSMAPEQSYNDIAQWDWTAAPSLFAPGRPCRTVRAVTEDDLDRALAEANEAPGVPWIVEVVVPPLDVPPLLADLAIAAGRTNIRASATLEAPGRAGEG